MPRFALPFGGWEYDVRALYRYVDGLQDFAEEVARTLCPALTLIFFWCSGYEGRPLWWKFNVSRSPSVGMVGNPVVVRDSGVVTRADLSGLQTY